MMMGSKSAMKNISGENKRLCNTIIVCGSVVIIICGGVVCSHQ
jgi:hypothetical protein